ncbi:helix-hairpin-helix domain-containing protein [Haloarchaeobius sp. DFWS5]|uniref:helix-hairpin-helix domain-containing protein n=1 Tax=Haloarchaeobius sp. DFWS5 TaxID=3446114 RepID=UPI003EBD640C
MRLPDRESVKVTTFVGVITFIAIQTWGFYIGAAIVVLFVSGTDLAIGFVQEEDDLDDAEAIRRAYVDGDLTDAEFERELSFALDDDAQEVRATVEEIGGIGPDTSAAIAEEFPTMYQLQKAKYDDLITIHGIGESTAGAVLQQFRR